MTIINNILLRGPAGSGKTSLLEKIAEESGAERIFIQLHEEIGYEDLFYGIDLDAFVTNASKNRAYIPRAVAKAIEISREKKVYLILDEIDKTKSRTEYMLLDALQNCRAIDPHGNEVRGNGDNLVVCATTNDTRELSDPTYRRFARIFLGYLPQEVEANLILGNTEEYYMDTRRKFIKRVLTEDNEVSTHRPKIARLLAKVAGNLRKEGIPVALNEIQRAYKLIMISRDIEEIMMSLEMSFIRKDEDIEVLNKVSGGHMHALAGTLLKMK